MENSERKYSVEYPVIIHTDCTDTVSGGEYLRLDPDDDGLGLVSFKSVNKYETHEIFMTKEQLEILGKIIPSFLENNKGVLE